MKDITDSLTNFAANLGTNKDKRNHNQFDIKAFSREELEALYYQDWIAGKVIEERKIKIKSMGVFNKGEEWVFDVE